MEDLYCANKKIKRLKKKIIEDMKGKYKLSQNLERVEKLIIDLKI